MDHLATAPSHRGRIHGPIGGSARPSPMDVGLLRDVVTVALGFAMGVLSGLFGVGGGVISQPGMRLLGLEPIIVIGTALPVIIPGAASGTRRYWHEGLIRWPAVAATVPAGLVAAVGGQRRRRARARRRPPAAARHRRAAAACRRTGWPAPRRRARRRAAGRDRRARGAGRPTRGHRLRAAAASAIGVVAGGLSGLLGIGGGVIMVPAFVHFVRMEVKAGHRHLARVRRRSSRCPAHHPRAARPRRLARRRRPRSSA